MKRLVSFLIIFTFVSAMLSPIVSASEILTKSEAIKLFEIGYGRSDLLLYGEINDLPWLSDSYRKKYFIYDRMTTYSYDEDYGTVGFNESSDGKPYPYTVNYYSHYAAVVEDNGEYEKFSFSTVDMDFIEGYILAYYTEDMKDMLFTVEYGHYDWDTEERVYWDVEAFRTDPNTGMLLVNSNVAYDRQMDRFSLGEKLTVLGFTSNSSNATMTLLCNSNIAIEGHTKTVETVTFENTKDGWRISGGSLFDVAYYYEEPSYGYEPGELERLTYDAVGNYTILKHGYPITWLSDFVTDSGKKGVWFFGNMMDFSDMFAQDQDVTITFTHSSKGKKYDEPKIYYRATVGEDLFSEAFVKSQDYIDYVRSVFVSELCDSWFYSEDGELEYFRDETSSGGILVSSEFYQKIRAKFPAYEFSSYNGVRMLSSNKARMEVVLYRYSAEMQKHVHYTTTIDARRTSDGWRIVGGEFFDVMEGKKAPKAYEPVKTGDGSGIEAVYFSMLVLLSLYGAFNFGKSRRQD